MEIRTHALVDKDLVGIPIEIETGKKAKVLLRTKDVMKVDEYGLVHGGFIFGLADYAAMLAVNEPTVVLWKANVIFIKPVKVGDELIAEANVVKSEGRKRFVKVMVYRKHEKVFEGDFICVITKKHVLKQ